MSVVGAVIVCGILAWLGWRPPSRERQIEGDLLVTLIWQSMGLALVTGVVTAVMKRGAPLAQALEWALGRVLLVNAAAGTWLLLWWPQWNTVWLLLSVALGLIGATLGRSALGRSAHSIVMLVSDGVSAMLFTAVSSSLLGLGSYGVFPVAYGLAVGVLAGLLTWIACRLFGTGRIDTR